MVMLHEKSKMRISFNVSIVLTVILSVVCCPVLFCAPRQSNSLAASIETQTSSQQAAIKSQKVIEKISEKSADLMNQYRHLLDQVQTLKVYNNQLSKLVHSQEQTKKLLADKLLDLDHMEQAIVPLMLSMIQALAQFVALDLPFLIDERQQRVQTLKAMMDRADVTTSAKYRRILEAFLVEIDYGRTIESYQGQLPVHTVEKAPLVNILRVGRVALYCQTLDGSSAYYWDKGAKNFLPLPVEYRLALARGFRVARKQAAPELLKLPVPAPENRP